MKTTLNNIKEMEDFANVFIKDIIENSGDKDKAIIIGLQGNLGSGKTTFVKSIAKILKIEGVITSPTFVIEKIYNLPDSNFFSNLIHIDAYRLKNGKELLSLNWKDILHNPSSIIFIEWPEIIADILPKDVRRIYFSFVDENTREVEY